MGTSRPRRFADLVPYATPGSLDDLHGPTSGVVRVSRHINTAPSPTYNFDDDGDQLAGYSAIVRDGDPNEQSALLDRATLLRLWPDLNLPKRCRETWTERFAELRALPVRALSV